jgi:hypothetical protein
MFQYDTQVCCISMALNIRMSLGLQTPSGWEMMFPVALYNLQTIKRRYTLAFANLVMATRSSNLSLLAG